MIDRVLEPDLFKHFGVDTTRGKSADKFDYGIHE